MHLVADNQLSFESTPPPTKVSRKRNKFKYRGGTGLDPEEKERAFGGVNMLLFGDWYQLKPVGGTALYSCRLDAPTQTDQLGLNLLWGSGKNTIRKCWDFTESQRCKDAWYNAFLTQCRYGELRGYFYYMLHGFPTGLPVGLGDEAHNLPQNPSQGTTCHCCTDKSWQTAANNDLYWKVWVDRFLNEGANAEELLNMECATCRNTRHQRKRVLEQEMLDSDTLHQSPFDAAPALYAKNAPRYHTIMLRASEYARVNNIALHWCWAQDIPLQREDRDLALEKLNEKRRRWLEHHDQETCHISSVVPLAHKLPVRITDCIDRKKSLYRGRRGYIVAWAPHEEETGV